MLEAIQITLGDSTLWDFPAVVDGTDMASSVTEEPAERW